MVAIQTLKKPPVSLATIVCHRSQVPGYRYHLHPLVDIFIIFWTLDMIKKTETFIILYFIIFWLLQNLYHIAFYHIFNFFIISILSYFKYDKALFFSNSNKFKRHVRLLLTIISNFFHILENLYHIALYHIFEFSKSLSYYKLSYSQKVYHIQFIIYNMIKSAFIHIFAIW